VGDRLPRMLGRVAGTSLIHNVIAPFSRFDIPVPGLRCNGPRNGRSPPAIPNRRNAAPSAPSPPPCESWTAGDPAPKPASTPRPDPAPVGTAHPTAARRLAKTAEPSGPPVRRRRELTVPRRPELGEQVTLS
jgi:hypothetical protein